MIKKQVEYQMKLLEKEADERKQTSMFTVLTDSASCDFGAKKELALPWPNIVFVACYSHHLNLMAGNALNHSSSKSVAVKARAVVSFFNYFPKQIARLQSCMKKLDVKIIKLVVQEDTRWYSNYGLMLTLSPARAILQKYKSSLSESDVILSNSTAVSVLDTINSSSFWRKMGLISEILRPLTM